MLNKTFRIKTPLTQPIKNIGIASNNGVSKKKSLAAQPQLISKSVAPNDYQSSTLLKQPSQLNTLYCPNNLLNSSFQSSPNNHFKKQTLFSNNKHQLNTTYRHSTFLTAQPHIRNYTTNTTTPQQSSNEKLGRNEIPETVQNLVDKAPKTGYHGESIDNMLKQGNYDKRQFAYFIANSSRFIFAAGIRLAVLKFLYSWSAAADVLAVAKIEVDVSNVPAGKTITVTWRGKPVFIKHRTEEEKKNINSFKMSQLRDPQSDADRTKNPDWSVLLAICTHLGCVPVTDAGMFDAFFCPCHGSHYDASGRIHKGPAPLNLEVPKHSFDGENTIVLG